MSGPCDVPLGNTALIFNLSRSLTPVAVANGTSAEQTFTVPGLVIGDVVIVQPVVSSVGVVLGGARVSAANTLAVTWGNPTGAPVTPTAGYFTVTVIRSTANPLPAGLE